MFVPYLILRLPSGEHLLFMGSSKYPGENDYESFVSRHGGSDNAFTEWEHTTYSLTIPQEYLWPALDRLAQHFVSPLLQASAVERELNSIESEFELHKNSDGCRRQQLLCSTAKKDHPIAKFGWGNLKSLSEFPKRDGVDPLKEMRSFFNRYYYGANMRVAVIGAYTLDELEAKVTKIFSPIPPLPRENGPYALPVNPLKITSWNASYRTPIMDFGPALEEQNMAKIYRIIPVKDRHSLCLIWQLPPQFENWKSKPCKLQNTSINYLSVGWSLTRALSSFFDRRLSLSSSRPRSTGVAICIVPRARFSSVLHGRYR